MCVCVCVLPLAEPHNKLYDSSHSSRPQDEYRELQNTLILVIVGNLDRSVGTRSLCSFVCVVIVLLIFCGVGEVRVRSAQ